MVIQGFQVHVLWELNMLFKIASIKRSPTSQLILLLLFIYLLLYQYAHIVYYEDPTSYFFNPSRAYAPSYSARRQIEAAAYLVDDSHFPFKRPASDTNPKMCIGIASIARKDANYLHFSVGSILEGLSEGERAQIELKILVAHTEPMKHPSWESQWLREVTDDVLSYERPFSNATWMKEKEENVTHVWSKSLFDYTHLLTACKNSGAGYLLMLEDDTIVARGWYAQTMRALVSIEQRNRHAVDKFLYLRLFYTERFLGWNSESNPTYIFSAIIAISAPLLLFYIPFARRPKALQTPHTIHFLALVYAPLLVALFFLSGRPSVLPIRRGVQQMSENACCSQALVFSSSSASGVIEWLSTQGKEDVREMTDTLIEKYADAGGGSRWALTPCAVQHIGKKSSKLGGNGGWDTEDRQNPRERLWSFGFEREGRRIMRLRLGEGYR